MWLKRKNYGWKRNCDKRIQSETENRKMKRRKRDTHTKVNHIVYFKHSWRWARMRNINDSLHWKRNTIEFKNYKLSFHQHMKHFAIFPLHSQCSLNFVCACLGVGFIWLSAPRAVLLTLFSFGFGRANEENSSVIFHFISRMFIFTANKRKEEIEEIEDENKSKEILMLTEQQGRGR